MSTPIDRALRSKNAVLGFAGVIGAVALWSIWGGDMFPREPDPTGDPQGWTETEMRRWLTSRNLTTTGKETRAELLARVEANMKSPKK